MLIAAGVRLIDVAQWRMLFNLDRRAFLVALAVTAGVLVLGVLPGVLLGVALSLARVLADVARPRDAVLRRLPTDRRFHDLDDDEGGSATPGVLVYRLYAPLLFANARHVAERVRELVARPGSRHALRGARPAGGGEHRRDRARSAARPLRRARERRRGRALRARQPAAARAARPMDRRRAAGQERFFASASAAVDDFIAEHPGTQ